MDYARKRGARMEMAALAQEHGMNRHDGGSRRWALRSRPWLLAVASITAIQPVAAMPSSRHVTTTTGVSFPIPNDFDEVELPGERPSAIDTIDHLYTDRAGALRIVVTHGPAEPAQVAGLPPSSGPLPQAYAEGFAVGISGAAQGIETFDVKPACDEPRCLPWKQSGMGTPRGGCEGWSRVRRIHGPQGSVDQ
jgi:hypothetical protein